MFKAAEEAKLVIVGDDGQLASEISQLSHPVIKSLQVRATADLSTVPPCVDILFMVGALQDHGGLRASFPHALIVWVAAREDLEQISPSEDIDELWAKPMAPAELGHKVFYLLNRLIAKQRDDFYARATDAAINSLPDIIWFKDNDGVHLKVNDAFCACVGKERDDVEGYGHYHVWGLTQEEYENSDYVCVDTDEIVNTTKSPGVFDELVMSVRGLRQFKTYKSPVLNGAGALMGTVGVARDITDLRNIDAKLQIVLDSMPFALMVTDECDRAIHINPRFEKIFHIQSDVVLGRPIRIDHLVNVMSCKPINDGTEEELQIKVSDNKTVQIVVQKTDILDIFNNVVGSLNIYIDVTRSRDVDRRLKEMAFKDSLTGLFTRHYLFHRLEERDAADRVALLTIDLDNFKSVNDLYGHAAGDSLLRQAGDILKDCFPDALCVRFGGDEFIVVAIGHVDSSVFVQSAQTLLSRLKEAFAHEPHAQAVGLSGGIAFASSLQGHDFDDLLRQSDHALYQAKRNGKGRIVVYGV